MLVGTRNQIYKTGLGKIYTKKIERVFLYDYF